MREGCENEWEHHHLLTVALAEFLNILILGFLSVESEKNNSHFLR